MNSAYSEGFLKYRDDQMSDSRAAARSLRCELSLANAKSNPVRGISVRQTRAEPLGCMIIVIPQGQNGNPC
jgi:hypothetical protein